MVARDRAKEVYTPKEDTEIVDEVVNIVKEKIGLTLFRKELWHILLQDPNALADLTIKNIKRQTEIAGSPIKLY